MDEFRIPIIERPLVSSHLFLNSMAEAPVEAGEINADDGIGLPPHCEFYKLAQKSPELLHWKRSLGSPAGCETYVHSFNILVPLKRVRKANEMAGQLDEIIGGRTEQKEVA